jgi:enoyl-CoA hydratase/carnithine racemase
VLYLLTAQTEDLREGVRAFFEKRAPRFTGR